HTRLDRAFRLQQGLAVRVAVGLDDLRLAGEDVLVELLDPVLAVAITIDEADELRGEAALRAAAGLRVAPRRVRLERDPADPRGCGGRLDHGRLLGWQVPRDHQVRLAGRELGRELAARDRVQAELRREELDHGRSLLRAQLLGVHDEPVPGHARGADDRATPVGELAALTG